MTIFLSKVWDFTVPAGPLQFSTVGWRDRARFELLHDGDRVVFVGTLGEPTAEKNRGRLLGMMEPTRVPVMSRDYDLRAWPQDFNDAGQYKWPYALINRRAWRFPEQPLWKETITDRRFNMDAVQGIVPLTPTEAEKVLAQELEDVPLLPLTVQAERRVDGSSIVARRVSPPPGLTRQGVMYLRNCEAFTYAMEITGKACTLPAFKIGWAFDFRLRARQFNQASMPELGGLTYQPKLHHLWGTAREAYAMEQRLLRHFDSRRHGANHEIVYDVVLDDIAGAFEKFSR